MPEKFTIEQHDERMRAILTPRAPVTPPIQRFREFIGRRSPSVEGRRRTLPKLPIKR